LATDGRLEDAVAWLLTAAGLFLVLFGVLAGVAVHGDAVERGRLRSGSTCR
jgi:hypothetical protein